MEVAARKLAEKQLAQSEARFRAAVQAISGILWTNNARGEMEGHQPGWAALTGQSYAQYQGVGWAAVVHPEDMQPTIDAWNDAVAARQAFVFTHRLRRRDGVWRRFTIRAVPVLEDGAIVEWVGVHTDITEAREAEAAMLRYSEVLEVEVAERTHELTLANARLEAEAEERQLVEETLRQSQKMEAVGQLTGGIAHDFNNLLQGISGSLELMRTRITQGRIERLDHYIETALGSTNRAATLTHRLLAFSRRQALDPRVTDVNELVGGMAELFRRTVGSSIAIKTSLIDDPWPVLCDPHQLENVLLNLVINARDAMPDGGQLLIETANTVLRSRRGTAKEWPPQEVPPGDYVALSIADTGTGMAPEVVARAFDPFFTTKPMGQGTGLGLSMVYGFVQQSGGHVRLRSEVGQGTTVAIYLPRHLEAATVVATVHAVAGAIASAATPTRVVLLVDDEPDVRMVVRDILTDLNYTVLEAESGQAGLSVVATKARIDLLLTDIGLPGGMDGRQFADAARQRRPDLKVLFITGDAADSVADDGRLEPATQVLTKPFAFDTLAARVRRMMDDQVASQVDPRRAPDIADRPT